MCLDRVPEEIPNLTFLDLRQCNKVSLLYKPKEEMHLLSSRLKGVSGMYLHMLWVLIRSASVSTSNEYPQHMFTCRNKKNIVSFQLKKCLIWSYALVCYRKLETLELLGVKMIKGMCLCRVPEVIPNLKFLNLRECNSVSELVLYNSALV